MDKKFQSNVLNFESLLNDIPIAIAFFNLDKELTYNNNTCREWFDKLSSSTFDLFNAKEQINAALSNELVSILEEVASNDSTSFIKEILVRTSIEGHKNLKVTFRKVYTGDVLEGVMSVFENEYHKEEYYALYKHQAHVDPLTGVYNRFGFREAFNLIKQKLISNNLNFCVLIADIDDLKQINDSRGHLFGDKAVKLVADCLSKCLRGDDILSRWGGDEFIIVLVSEFSIHHVKKLREQVLERIHHTINSQAVEIGISIGSAIYLEDGNELDELIDYADKAMYQEKDNKHKRKQNQ